MAKTIEDYKKDYEAAKAAGDAAGMKAANDAANALRAAQGEQAQYAASDIASVAAKAYTPVNSTSAAGINYDNYLSEVAKQQEYIAANPTASQTHSAQEKQEKYGGIMDATADSGYDAGDDEGYSGGAGSSGGGLSVPQGGSLAGYVEDYSGYLSQMNAAAREAALAQLKAAYEKNLAALDRAGTGIAEQYQAARDLSAGSSAVSGRNFAEYAAAAGLNNGTAGQAELARSVTLQNNLNGINTAEADAVADLQLARANAEIEYNNAIAQAEANGDYQTASALYQEKVRVQEALIELELQEQQNALKRYQLEYQAQQDAISNQLAADKFDFQRQQYADSLTQSQNSALAAYGETYLKLGIMPSSAMLAAMGITAVDAQRYIAALGK